MDQLTTGISFIQRLLEQETYFDWKPKFDFQDFLRRELRACAPPDVRKPSGDVEHARMMIREGIGTFLGVQNPQHLLLVQTSPGSGKTTATAAAAEAMASSGRRVAYAGPRHDFYADLIDKAQFPDWWYEWLPRQIADEAEGKPETCRHAGQINQWINRGYTAMDFCSGVCGWSYINKSCPWHAQKKCGKPVIFIQHQHVTSGHPMKFDVLFGDESPINTFANEWRIPARWVLPPGMPTDDPVTHLLHHLGALCQQTAKPLMGWQLIDELGGADEVIAACETVSIPTESIDAWGAIHRPEDVEQAPYFHIFDTVGLLLREARQYKDHVKAPQRVIASGGHLTLLLRRMPDYKHLPAHIVWLDATGRPELYERLFQREVKVLDARPKLNGKIYQVVDRTNGKSMLDESMKADQAWKLIERIIQKYGYKSPSVIGFKKFVEKAPEMYRTGHFYAARGTNHHEDADVVFVVGTPQPNFYSLATTAKMLFFERDVEFDTTWTMKEAVYHYVGADGLGRSYPVSGFWRDADLQTILEISREDEMIQAAHRGRPVNHATDIWMLTNLPIHALPPDELLTIRDIMDAPDGVHVFKWSQVMALTEQQETITRAEIEALGINHETAISYLKKIGELPGWEVVRLQGNRGGKPALTARRTFPIAETTIN